jgi:hypothetical protein
MKNSGQGSRKAPGDLIRVSATAVIMAAISVILGAGPALAADDASKPDTAAGQSLVTRILADQAITIEVLVILVGVVLAFAYGRYRHSVNGRRSAHARARGSQAHARSARSPRQTARSRRQTARSRRQPAAAPRAGAAPARQAAGQPPDADDFPSWPGPPGPYALHPDHPSWPGRPDPRWAATEAALRADDYSGWPAADAPPWRDAEPPPGAGGVPLQAPGSAVPSALPDRVRGDFAPPAEADPGAVITPRAGPTGVIDRVRTEAAWVQAERVQVWDAGSVELATWIISEANQQATEIRHEARDQVAASLAEAKQEAAKLVAKASEQATATLTAAEAEAAEIRATVTKLTADLGGVAAQITANLVGLAPPATKPVTRPAVRPVIEPTSEAVTSLAAQPAAPPASQPGTRPTPRSAAKPGTRTASKPGSRRAGKAGTGSGPKGQPRQLVAIRVVAAATAALFLFAIISGATEVALHGFSFFVFRSTGVGETGPTGLQEDQGPGQPDAPRPTPTDIKVKPGPRGTVANGQ